MFGGGQAQAGIVHSQPTASHATPSNLYQVRGASHNELIYCKKQYVGRIIGSKGSTIRDLQQRSGTKIQIKQDVPFGADCEVTISGNSEGVKMAKQMIQQIIG